MRILLFPSAYDAWTHQWVDRCCSTEPAPPMPIGNHQNSVGSDGNIIAAATAFISERLGNDVNQNITFQLSNITIAAYMLKPRRHIWSDDDSDDQFYSSAGLCILSTLRASSILAVRASGLSIRLRSSPLSISRSIPVIFPASSGWWLKIRGYNCSPIIFF